MFTGIVSSVGTVVEAGPNRLGIAAASATRRLKIGSSVAVNGCCLTVVKKHGAAFFADVVPETLRRTNLGLATAGSRVNLELPLGAAGLLDGHLVQGHVDARDDGPEDDEGWPQAASSRSACRRPCVGSSWRRVRSRSTA